MKWRSYKKRGKRKEKERRGKIKDVAAMTVEFK